MVECGDEPIVDAGDGAPTARRQITGALFPACRGRFVGLVEKLSKYERNSDLGANPCLRSAVRYFPTWGNARFDTLTMQFGGKKNPDSLAFDS